MNLMQVFLEALPAMGIAESAVARGPAHVAGIDVARFSENARQAAVDRSKS